MIRKILLACFLIVTAQAALAQQTGAATFQEGRHYFKINQVTTPPAEDSVEVTIVFSYLCSHCNVLEPYVENWYGKQPDYVRMNRMHVNFGGPQELYARGYIVAEMTGISDESHPVMMDTIWKKNERFRNPNQLAGFYSQFGVDPDRFLANYASFAADSQLRRVQRDTRIFGVTGTPSIIINRKYRVPNTSGIWDVVDYLVAQERAAYTP